MAVSRLIGLKIFVVFLLCCSSEINAKIQLPEGLTEEGYCVACETMAAHIFKRLSSPSLDKRSDRVEGLLKNLCSQGYFKSVTEFPPRDMVTACKHILQGHKSQMASAVESVMTSSGTLAELNTALCHISSQACRAVRQPAHFQTVHDIKPITDEETLDAIEAYIAAHNGEVKMPRPGRKDEL